MKVTNSNKQVMSKRLRNIDGVKEVKIGRASVEDRRMGNAHVTGKGADEATYDDDREMRKRMGGVFGMMY